MSVKRGVRLQAAFAEWLRAWWPSAESAPNGRNGRDVLGTPGVAFEVKTAAESFRSAAAVAQAERNAGDDVAIVVYLPPGVGARSIETGALFIMSAPAGMRLLEEAGYTGRTR